MEGAFEETVMSNRTCVQVCNAIAHEVGTTPDAGRFRVLRECGLNSLTALPVLGPRCHIDELLEAIVVRISSEVAMSTTFHVDILCGGIDAPLTCYKTRTALLLTAVRGAGVGFFVFVFWKQKQKILGITLST